MQTHKRARSFRLTAALAAAAIAALAVVTHAAGQEQAPDQVQQQAPGRLPIRGTSVTLIPPPGFTASRTERGIENTATGTKITISEAAADAYPALADRFKSAKSLTDGYADQGVTIRSVRTI